MRTFTPVLAGFGLVLAAGCSDNRLSGYQITDSQLIIQQDNDFQACDLTGEAPVCTADEALKPFVAEYRFADDVVAWVGFTSGAPEAPAVHGNQSYAWMTDRMSGERTMLSSMPAQGSLRVTPQWVFWQDMRNDSNGRCYSDDADSDCAVDIYGYHRGRKEELRITPQSTVLGRTSTLGDVSYSATDLHLVFVDRRDLGRDCFEQGKLRAEQTECETNLYVIDLQTLEERAFETTFTHQNWPKIAGTRVVWLDTPEVVEGEQGTYLARDLSDTGPGVRVGPPVQLFRRYEHQGDWLITQVADDQVGTTIRATHLVTGEEKTLTAPGEEGLLPNMAGSRVVWRDANAEKLTVYDLQTDRRFVAFE